MSYRNKVQPLGFTVARIVAATLLLWALARHPYGYYTLLRFVVCGVTAYGAYLAVGFKKAGWAWVLGCVAVLFNPVIPLHLNREIWSFIDIGVAIVLIVSVPMLRSRK